MSRRVLQGDLSQVSDNTPCQLLIPSSETALFMPCSKFVKGEAKTKHRVRQFQWNLRENIKILKWVQYRIVKI